MQPVSMAQLPRLPSFPLREDSRAFSSSGFASWDERRARRFRVLLSLVTRAVCRSKQNGDSGIPKREREASGRGGSQEHKEHYQGASQGRGEEHTEHCRGAPQGSTLGERSKRGGHEEHCGAMGVMGRTAREHGEHYVASTESSTGSTAGEHREHGGHEEHAGV